jgi:hypothetical protein
MSVENSLEKLKSMIADFSSDADLTPVLLEQRRDRICDLEEAMKTLPEAYDMAKGNEGKIHHHFGTGVYGRELFIPKGNVIVSKIHRAKTFNVIAKGVISVICPNNGYNTYEGPYCFVSEPFTKRVVIAHEDTLWITSHGYSGSEDLDEVENEIIAKDFEEFKFLKGEIK